MVEVGTGESAFQPLEPGASVNIVAGPQGGFHIWMAVRTRPPVKPEGVELVYRVVDPDSRREISLNGMRARLEENGEWLELAGLLGLVPRPEDVSGRDVLLRMELRDADGRSAADERRVRARGP